MSMSHSRRVVAVCIAACLAGAAVSAASPAPAVVLLAKGVVRDASGAPLADFPVAALLDPPNSQLADVSAGTRAYYRSLTKTTTDSSGRFTLALPSSELPNDVADADGPVAVTIMGSDRRGLVTQALSLRPGGKVWTVSDRDIDAANDTTDFAVDGADATPSSEAAGSPEPGSTDSGEVAAVIDRPSTRTAILRAGDSGAANVIFTVRSPSSWGPLASAAIDEDDPAGQPGGAADPASLFAPCGDRGESNLIISSGRTKDVGVTVARVYSAGGTTNSFDYNETKSTKFEIAITLAGKGFVGGGGLVNSAVNESGTTLEGGTFQGLSQRLTWRFAEYKIICFGDNPKTKDRIEQTYDSGYRMWRPNRWTGGASYVKWNPFPCQKKNSTSTTARSFYRSNSRTVTMSAAFQIGGFLNASQEFEHSAAGRLTYVKTSPSATSLIYLCGNNDLPTTADIVREGKPSAAS